MPSVETNKAVWRDEYTWPQRGDEWSAPWGNAATQWHCVILPRIHAFLPAHTVLEIAPGYGRWTQFLQPEAQHLIAVDLSESCIEACKSRFADATNISYHVNDGKSLATVADGSVNFAFSFDSLVHADLDVLRAYLAELRNKLSPDGVAFLHHSNIGVYARRFAIQNHLPRNLWRVLGALWFAGHSHDRDFSVTAAGVETNLSRNGTGVHCARDTELVSRSSDRHVLDANPGRLEVGVPESGLGEQSVHATSCRRPPDQPSLQFSNVTTRRPRARNDGSTIAIAPRDVCGLPPPIALRVVLPDQRGSAMAVAEPHLVRRANGTVIATPTVLLHYIRVHGDIQPKFAEAIGHSCR